MAENYTLIDVEEMTGAGRFAIQLWAREGLLLPLEETRGAGRGVHRRFSLEEVELAALMSPLSGYCSLDALRAFVKRYRARATREKFAHTRTRALIDAARSGDETIYMSFVFEEPSNVSIDVFRWDQTNPGPPRHISVASKALIVNLARTWSRIRERTPS